MVTTFDPMRPLPPITTIFMFLFIAVGHEEHWSCNDRRRQLLPPSCRRFDARLDTLHTNPTIGAWRESSRRRRDAVPSRGEARPGWRHPWLVPPTSIRDREVAP